jgi:hypothetical protein
MRGRMDELPKRRKRGPSWDRAVIDRAKERRRLGDTIAEIKRTLLTDLAEDVPASTIKSWVGDVHPDVSGEWRLWERLPAEPDPAIVLPVLAATTWATGGRVTSFTNEQARWITLLIRIDPDRIWPVSYQLARAWIEAVETDDQAELRRLQSAEAETHAMNRWPTLKADTARLIEKGKRVAADIRAGRDPFLDGRPYEPEGK